MSLESLPEGTTLQDSYVFACPHCDHQQITKPSLLMLNGFNRGRGICGRCGEAILMRIDGDKILATPYELVESDLTATTVDAFNRKFGNPEACQ